MSRLRIEVSRRLSSFPHNQKEAFDESLWHPDIKQYPDALYLKIEITGLQVEYNKFVKMWDDRSWYIILAVGTIITYEKCNDALERLEKEKKQYYKI